MKRFLVILMLVCLPVAAFAGMGAGKFLLAGTSSGGSGGGGGGGASYADSFATISSYWTTMTGSYALTSTTYYALGTQAGERSYNFYGRTITANQYSTVTLQSGSMPMYNSAIFVRGSADGSRYEALSDGSSIYLKKCTALTSCTNLTSATLDVPSTATIKLSVDSNNTLTFYSNNSSVVSYTDSSSPITTGYPGIAPYGQSAEMHNWLGGDL